MEETKNTSAASQPEKAKSEKPKKADKKQEKKSGSFLAEHRAEIRKVTWPNRQELMRETVTVIVVSLLVGAIIFAMDTVISFSYDKLMNIGGANTASSDTSNEINPADLINVEPGDENSPVEVEVESGADANAQDAAQSNENADAENSGAENPDGGNAEEGNSGTEGSEAGGAEAGNAEAENTPAENAEQ